ncbi:MAG: hypothetical protein Q9163_000065 [Psora crenata]
MEELQTRHSREHRDLQARIIQKKKSATKKTRKGVNDECAELERQLKERQADELAQLDGKPDGYGRDICKHIQEPTDGYVNPETDDVSRSLRCISLSSAPAPNGHVKKPNRQKARQARKAAELEAAIEQAEKEAADIPDLRDKEVRAMREAYQSRGLQEQDIRSDGHCLYAAVADQLIDAGVGLKPSIHLDIDCSEMAGYMVTRQVAASYIFSHPDDFCPFLEEPLESYVKTIRETGEWGGHLEILALAKAYNVDINVLQGDGSVEQIGSGDTGPQAALWLAYYRHSYGLGEHYNSLRQVR